MGIVKKLVELLNGELEFESEYGKGSTFGFSNNFRIQKIRTELANNTIKIVSSSVAVLEEEKKAGIGAGMNYVLTKPFLPLDPHRIISKIV